MHSIRCLCGKIVCQVDQMPGPARHQAEPPPPSSGGSNGYNGPSVVILCRHCKRYVVLHTTAITEIRFTSDVRQLEQHLHR